MPESALHTPLHLLMLLGNALGAFGALHATAGTQEEVEKRCACVSSPFKLTTASTLPFCQTSTCIGLCPVDRRREQLAKHSCGKLQLKPQKCVKYRGAATNWQLVPPIYR
jgi:hypothetical protein